MTTTHASPLARLITPIIKPAIALFAALVVGGAWAAYDQIWTPTTQTDGKYYWDESSNWVNGTAEYGNYVINSPSSAEIYFSSSYSSTSATWLFMENGGSVTFSGDDASCGLSLSGNMTIGTGLAATQLSINKGYYSVGGSIVLASGSNNGSLTISGGTVETAAVIGGTDSGIATLELGGGILRAMGGGTFIGSGVAASVTGASTIDTNGKAISIETAITGSGTLTITGGGVATFTTAPTCGLKVENGVAVLPGNSKTGAIEIGAHGVLAFDLTGWTIANGTAYTLAWNVAALTIPAGETYADSIFTIGPDFTSTITLDGTTIKATATSDATYTGDTANVRYITTTLNGGYMDDVNSWINIEKGPNGAYNDSENNYANPNFQGDAQRRDIVVILGNATVSTWGANRPSNFTYVVRGSDTKLTLNNGDISTATDLAVANIYNAGTITTENSVGTINLSISNPITTGGTVVISGGAMTFPAGSTFADISATTVKVTGTVTGTTVAADGTIGAGSTLFTLTGATPTFANLTVTVSINNADTAIHYTKGDNGVYTAGKVFYWVGKGVSIESTAGWAFAPDGSDADSTTELPTYYDVGLFGSVANSLSYFPSSSLVANYNIVATGNHEFNHGSGAECKLGSASYKPQLVVLANSNVTFRNRKGSNGGARTYIYSSISGSGRIITSSEKNADAVILYGNITDFEGIIDARTSTGNAYPIFRIGSTASVDNRLSRWYICTNGQYIVRTDRNDYNCPFESAGSTFQFGLLRAYIGPSNNSNNNQTFVLGEKIEGDSWLRGKWYYQNDKIRWLSKTSTFTQAITNMYEIAVMGGGNVYVEKDSTVNGNAATFVPSVIKFLSYTDSENVVRGGGYLTLDGNNSAIAGDIINAIAVAGDGETQVATGFNVEAVEGGVSANVTKSAVLNNAVGFNKKGAGALTLSGAFTKLGVVNVTEGSLVIVATSALAEGTAYTCAADTACTVSGTTYTFGPGVATFNSTAYPALQSAVDAAVSAGGGTVTLIANVEEDVLIEAAGVSIVLGDYIVTGTVTSSEDYDIVYDENTKTWTSSETANFIWCGGNGTSWSTPANWKKNAVPGETDKVIFPETTIEGGWVVALDSATTVAKITANGPVTFSGARIAVSDDGDSHGVVGNAVITLGDNAGFDAGYLGTLTIDNALIISGTPDHPVIIKGSNSNGAGPTLNFNGNISGTGYLSTGGARSTVNFNGNNTAFRGTVSAPHDGVGGSEGRNYVYFANGNATSSQATWLVGMIIRDNYNYNFAKAKGDTYYFGAFNGNMRNNVDANYQNPSTFVLGETDDNFTLSYEGRPSEGRRDYICKKGIGTMTFTGTNVRGYDLQNGVTELMTSGSLPSQTIKMNGGALKLNAAITVDTDPSEKLEFVAEKTATVDDGGEDRTFASAIGNDKSANFTKKGSGALTLAAPPTYTGTTKVEDGVLYVINGEYSLTLDSSTAEVTTDKDGYRKFVPASVTIAAPTVVWGDDFADVTVSAAVTSNYGEGGLTYNLKIGGNVVEGAVGTVENGIVTFSGVDVSGLNLSRYGDVSVEVTASYGGSQAATSGSKNVMFADEQDWVDENYETTTTAAAGGSWQTAVSYDGETHKAAVVDNRFSATNCTTGDVVTVTIKDVVYTMLSDTTEIDADAQGAVALSTNVVNDVVSTNFFVLTRSNDVVSWTAADGVAGNTNVAYDIELTFDYVNGKYSVSINGTALTIGGVAAFDIVKTANQYVKDIDFLGAGSIKAIEGVQYDAMMAVDQNGVRYATVQEAVDANAGKKGATVTLLHDTANTSFTGWKYDAASKTFIWSVYGVLLLVF